MTATRYNLPVSRQNWTLSSPAGRFSANRVSRYFRHRNLGHIADRVSQTIGGGRFLSYQSIFLLLWVGSNFVLTRLYVAHHPGCLYRSRGIAHFHPKPECSSWIRPWDPYPFLALTLLLSLQAAFAAPLILLSQNRQKLRDAVNENAGRGEAQDLKHTDEYLIDEVISLRLRLNGALTRRAAEEEIRRLDEAPS